MDSITYKNLSIKDKLRNLLKIRKSAEKLNQNNNNTKTTSNLSSLPYNNNEDKINNYNSDYLSGDEEPDIINKNSDYTKNLNARNIKKRKAWIKQQKKKNTKKYFKIVWKYGK